MLRITWTPNTGAAVTVSRGGFGGYVWQRYGQIETRNGGPTVEMAVWALCAQCRKDGVV